MSMSPSSRGRLAALLPIATILLAASPSRGATWRTGVSYGAATVMDLYVPDKPATPAPIVVALHSCGGTAMGAHAWLQSAADKYGFMIITPTADGGCFDATPARTGERANVVKMVQYVVTMNGGDAKRVYSVGVSSGACMTQALLAAYPEVFAAGSSLAGVPAGAWTGGNSYAWSTAGVSGGQAWGDKVRAADKDFTGTRPRVQLWQGMGDTTLTYSLAYPAEVAQWTNVFGVTDADATKESIKPPGAQDTWARTSYKDSSGTVVVEANSGPSNVPHDLTRRGLFGDVVRFFGFDGSTPGGGSSGGAPAVGGGAPGGRNGSAAGMSGTSSGGTIGTGGVAPGTGGMATSSGGTSGSSGSATGGSSASGGGTGTGGKSSGGSGSGGSDNSGTGGSSPGDTGGSGGCAVVGRASGPGSALASILVMLCGLLVVRRRSRR